MKRIRKNSKKQIKEISEKTKTVKVFKLDNRFHGEFVSWGNSDEIYEKLIDELNHGSMILYDEKAVLKYDSQYWYELNF